MANHAFVIAANTKTANYWALIVLVSIWGGWLGQREGAHIGQGLGWLGLLMGACAGCAVAQGIYAVPTLAQAGIAVVLVGVTCVLMTRY